ncbi:hypothetical protein H0H92_001274 [Tricholoma furcatifolium]|nr:hypothetical protein H0H92_001274 [Tricholoma furcatifolium]
MSSKTEPLTPRQSEILTNPTSCSVSAMDLKTKPTKKRGRENDENHPPSRIMETQKAPKLESPTGTPGSRKLSRTVALSIINNDAPPRIVPEFLESIEAVKEHLGHLTERHGIQKEFKEAFQVELEEMQKELRDVRMETLRLRQNLRKAREEHEAEMSAKLAEANRQ